MSDLPCSHLAALHNTVEHSLLFSRNAVTQPLIVHIHVLHPRQRVRPYQELAFLFSLRTRSIPSTLVRVPVTLFQTKPCFSQTLPCPNPTSPVHVFFFAQHAPGARASLHSQDMGGSQSSLGSAAPFTQGGGPATQPHSSDGGHSLHSECAFK